MQILKQERYFYLYHYANRIVTCSCGKQMKYSTLSYHKKTKKHLDHVPSYVSPTVYPPLSWK